jgi:hypothetical protein
MISSIDGPYAGSRHDGYLLAKSGLLVDVFPRALSNTTAESPDGNFCVYGDPAYGTSKYIVTGFGKNNQTADMATFNLRMSAVRECVEWEFGLVASLWAFVDYSKNQKIYLQPVGKYYMVAVLLKNMHSCFYPSQTSSYFECPPPSLREYLYS